MLGIIDRLFCEIEGKYEEKTKNKPKKNVSGPKNGIGTLFINYLNDGGLNGEWRKDKEKFKHDLLNDIKTFLFGKWKKPWKEAIVTDENGKRLPFCNIKKRPYRGFLTLLNLENHTKQSPFFVTPDYVRKNGGKITNPDEKTYAVGWIAFQKDEVTGKLFRCDPDEADVFLPKYYPVISTDFVEGIKVPEFKITTFQKKELIEYVENIIQAIKKRLPPIFYDEKDSCYYAPLKDEIHLVKIDAFTDIVNYYKVLFHEVIHSTKHPSRLGRGKPLKDSHNSKAEYAAEELVAEIGAAIMATELSLNYDRQNTIVYLKGWLDEAVKKSGKDQDSILLEAYGYAIDAVEYLLKDVDVDKILPKSILERAKTEGEKPEEKPENKAGNDNLPEEKKKEPVTIKKNDKKKEEEEKKEKPAKLTKSIKMDIVELPVNKIFTDEKRFQNRINAFSEESKNRIIRAVEEGSFDWAKFDPITVWLDPKDQKYYVLSGHSRRAAFIELAKKDPLFRNIPCKIFKGTETAAIDFALKSNTLATKETEVERALYYNRQRTICELKKGLNGKNDCEKLVETECRNNEGKNANYILNLSYLNPKGYLIDSLMRMGIEKDNDSTNVLRTIANWVGEARRRNPEISDQQETEIAQFLLNGGYGNKKGQFRNKNAFFERLDVAFEKWKANGANPNVSLNLANRLSKSEFEKEWDERLAKAKEEYDNAVAEHQEKYKKYLQAVIDGVITQARMDELMLPLTAYVEKCRKEYERIRGQKDDVKKASSSQTTLWGIGNRIDIIEINNQFNHEIDLLSKNKLPKNHIFKLGDPTEKLLAAGIPNLEIELSASRLLNKSKQEEHKFELTELRNLPILIQNPIAVFRSATQLGAFVVMLEIEKKGKPFVVALHLKAFGNNHINSIRSIHYRKARHLINWIKEKLLLWVDKEKALNWLSKQRYNSADVGYTIKSVTNIIKNFVNPNNESDNSLGRNSLGLVNL